MKKLVLGTLIALAVTQAAGCVIVSGDDGGDYAHVSATWEIKTLGTSQTLTCPPGYTTAALFNQAIDSAGRPIGSCAHSSDNNESTCFVDLFDCGAHAGTSFPLPPTEYMTWVSITDDSTSSVWASGVPAYLNVAAVDLTYNAQLLEDGGYFYVAWDLRRMSDNSPVSCSAAGADGADLTATVANSTESKTDVWDCVDGANYTSGLRAATYTVVLSALNTSDQSIGEALELTNKTIGRQNAITNLGTVQIPIRNL